jgi:multimeric flavodoxin WrbA
MKIALINGSPKIKYSASGCLLQELMTFLENDNNTITEYYFRKPQLSKEEMEQLGEYNILVFAFPLYVDGIPSHLLNCLIQLEGFFSTVKEKDIIVYCLVNCGFYEGHQTAVAIEMMKNWCTKAGLKWGQGVGIGAGGMLLSVKNVPIGHGPKKNLGVALKKLANNILECSTGEDIFITANFPRILYKLAAEMGWRKSIKANGLKRRDLLMKK